MIPMLLYIFLNISLFECRHITTNNLRESHFGTCITGKGKIGSCIYLKECTFIYNIIRTTTLTRRDRFFLKQNQCGYKHNKVLICCPQEFKKLPTIIDKYLPQSDQCSVTTSSRIYGGNATKIDEFPWMALLEYNRDPTVKSFLCGGSLINNRYVLTAAHCVTGGPIDEGWLLKRVRLGEWNLDTDIDCVISLTGEKDCAPKPLDVEIENVLPHPLYKKNSRHQHHDIALIRLRENITFSDFVKPICLPLAGNLRQANLDGVRMTIAGWGNTETTLFSNIKLKASIKGFNMSKCRKLYGHIMIDQSQICAGGENLADSCKGDSGGPLIITVINNRTGPYYSLGGITSFGPWPCGLQDWPGVYTRVGEYIEWIIKNIHKLEHNTSSNSTKILSTIENPS